MEVCETMQRPRKRRNGWNVSLGGSSPYRSQVGTNHQAATWNEHGLWMDELYRRDPQAAIADYKDRADFIEQTTTTRDHHLNPAVADYYARNPSELAKHQRRYSAPWLTA